MSDSDACRDDEIVSAYLDGEATPAERARVENDPRLQARLAELRAVAAAVGTPHFFADSPRRDELIAQALAVAGTSPAPSSDAGGGKVVDLDAARRQRRRLVVLSAAAGLLLLIVAVPLLSRDRTGPQTAVEVAATAPEAAAVGDASDEDQESDTSTPEANAETDGVEAEPPAAVTTSLAPLPTAADAIELALVDLGSFVARPAAQLAVTEAIDAVLATETASGFEPRPAQLADVGSMCDAELRASDDELGELLYAVSFVLPDGQHLVLLYALPPNGAVNGTHRIHEVLVDGCRAVSVETL